MPARVEVVLIRHLVGHARNRRKHIDRRIVHALGELARKQDVSVEDSLGGIGDRLGHVVALDEHGVETRDRATALQRARALEKSRQHGEDARCEALGRRSFASRKTNLPLRLRKSGDRVKHEKDIESLIAEELRRAARDRSRTHAHERTFVTSRDHDDRTAHAFFAQNMLDEFGDLTAALADQSDDIDLRAGSARNRSEQRALANARAGEDSHALTLADGEHRVNRAHAGWQHIAHHATSERTGAGGPERLRRTAVNRALSIDRFAERVHHAAQPRFAHANGCERLFGHHAHATRNSIGLGEQHDQRARSVETDHFATRRIGAMRHLNPHQRADGKRKLIDGKNKSAH